MHKVFREHLSHLYPQAHTCRLPHSLYFHSLFPSYAHTHIHMHTLVWEAGVWVGQMPGPDLQVDTRHHHNQWCCLIQLCGLKLPQAQKVRCTQDDASLWSAQHFTLEQQNKKDLSYHLKQEQKTSDWLKLQRTLVL